MSRRLRVVVRWRARRTRLGRFVSGSLAAHGLVLAAVVIVPLVHRTAPAIDDAMVVELAGPAAAAPAAPAAPAVKTPAAAPAPPPPPKEAHTVREVPVPKPKAKDEKKKPEPPEPTPAPPGPQAATPGPLPSPAATPSSGTGTGVTASVGGGEAALGWYQAAVKSALESRWMKPYLENQGTTYSVTVAFDIARDGSVRDVRIVGPSGVPSLDRSAERAVLEASPLPPVPPTWPGSTLPATMRFDLTPGTP